MKTQHKFAWLALALAISAGGCAKTSVATHEQQRVQAFEQQASAQHDIWLLRWQARNRMLASLTPAHRAAVTQLAAQLMTADAPDVKGAVANVNKLLTPHEKAAIIATDHWLSQRERRDTDVQRQAMLAADPFLRFSPRNPAPADAGSVLLVSITNAIALHTSLAVRGTSESQERSTQNKSGRSR